MTSQNLSDFEITAHLFRLMRDSGIRKADALLRRAYEDMPSVDRRRIKDCAAQLAKRLSEESWR